MGASRFFTGTTDVLSVGTVSALNTLFSSGGTILFWFRPIGLGGGSNSYMTQAGTATTGYRTSIITGSNYVFQFESVWSGATGKWTAGSAVFNFWVHWAISYNTSSTSNNPIIYQGGVSKTVTRVTAPSGSVTNSSTGFFIGNDATNSKHVNGNMAYVHAYNTVLSASQIQELMDRPGTITTNLQGYWPVLGSDSPELDLSGNARNATVTGTFEQFIGPPVRRK